MKNILKKFAKIKAITPAIIVGAIVITSLSSYKAQVYKVNAESLSEYEDSADAAKLSLPEVVELPEENTSDKEAQTLANIKEPGSYKDGTYTGSANGWGGKISVSVNIKNSKIKRIKVISASSETPQYFAKARAVIGSIIKRQSTNVDAISGATFSSNGIIKAVRNALSKAATGKTQSSKNKSDSDNESTSDNTDPTLTLDGDYNDGEYEGYAKSYGTGYITVKINIKSNRLTKVKITDAPSDDYVNAGAYVSDLKGLIKKIISSQSTKVDGVSGATKSSDAIKNAIIMALNSAKSSTAQDANDTSEEEEQTDDTVITDSPYADGVYEVSANVIAIEEEWGYDFESYIVTMDVTIKSGRVTDVGNYRYSYEDTINAGYMENAANGNKYSKGVVTQIKAIKDLSVGVSESNIDAVSGATCSSKAIIQGVNAALTAALNAQ